MSTTTSRLLVLHGPNLNLLGTREPELYGTQTLADIDAELARRAGLRHATIKCIQSNHEGVLVDAIQSAAGHYDALIINPAAYGHTSIALLDALSAIAVPAIEVHLSQLAKREPFRHSTLIGRACIGTIAGFAARSYYLALEAALDLLKERDERHTQESH